MSVKQYTAGVVKRRIHIRTVHFATLAFVDKNESASICLGFWLFIVYHFLVYGTREGQKQTK